MLMDARAWLLLASNGRAVLREASSVSWVSAMDVSMDGSNGLRRQ